MSTSPTTQAQAALELLRDSLTALRADVQDDATYRLYAQGTEAEIKRLETELRNMADDETFAARIRAALEEADADVLADYLHVSKPTVERWSRGENLPHEGMRPAVIRALDKLAL